MTFCGSCEQPVQSNALQEAVGHSCLKMRCFMLDSVEKRLINFVNITVEYSFLFSLVLKV